MKRLLILLLALMPITALAQGFQIEDNTIKWQKVYNTDMTFDEIYTAMVTSNDFDEIQALDNCIFAKIKPVDYVPEDYGFRYGNSNTLLLNGALGPVTVRIDVKEGRYRVTATDFTITCTTSAGIRMHGHTCKLEDYALKRGQPNSQMTDQFGPIFEQFLTRKTTFTKVEDDW